MRNIILATAVLLGALSAGGADRISWLPKDGVSADAVRTLDCRYTGAKLTGCDDAEKSGRWTVSHSSIDEGNGTTSHEWRFVARQDMTDAGVAVGFDRASWTSDNYVMLPSAVYGGNRQRIVSRDYATGYDRSDYYRKNLALTSNPIPQLSPEFGAVSRLELTACNTATPAFVILDRHNRRGSILLTDQGMPAGDEIRDFGLIVEETPDRSGASFIVSAPGVRELKPEFIGFSDSPDRGMTFHKGDTVTIRVRSIDFACDDVPDLLLRFMAERKNQPGGSGRDVRNLMPMSHVRQVMMKDIDRRYRADSIVEFYCPENADWISYGWVGGLMNTFPALAEGYEEHRRRVVNTFDFGLSHGGGASGYFYDVVGADGDVVRRDASERIPEIGLTRKNADMLYWMVKQLMLMDRQGHRSEIKPEWEARVKRLADAFVDTWRRHATWGNYINVETGDIAVYNTTGGAMAPAGLALASVYFDNPEYLTVAREGAKAMYDEFALKGFTSGGCGDILQNADSETSVALLTSMITLYELTGEEPYLASAEVLAALCSSWTVSYDYVLPPETPLAQLEANLTGAVWASTQNKHGAPGFCTQSGDALFKLYRATGNRLYAALLRDVIHAHAEGIHPSGFITERLTYCDADSRGTRGDGSHGGTGWNETNGAMMAIEIPGIYVRKDIGEYFVFDHVEVTDFNKKKDAIEMTLRNPTAYDAAVTVLVEDAADAAKPLGDNRFTEWTRRVTVPAGKSAKCRIRL